MWSTRRRTDACSVPNRRVSDNHRRLVLGGRFGGDCFTGPVDLVDRFHASGHEVHEEIVAQGLRGGEVGFAAAHGGDFLHELHEGEVAGEHEGVDHDVGAFAASDFFEGLGDDERVEAEGVLVDAAVGEGEGAGLSVSDHDDLLHVFILASQDALGEAKAFAGVGVVGADLDA
jgi:hypothetical protein